MDGHLDFERQRRPAKGINRQNFKNGGEMKMRKCGMVILISLFVIVSSAVAVPKEASNITISKGKVFLNLKDADIKTVLQIFAKATGANIIASDDVTGKVTVTFSGIDPKDGLEAVLRTKGLDWFEEAGTIFVSTKKILRTYYLANAKPSDLQATLTAILPTGSVVTADDSYNALVIQTSSDYLPRLERLIKELDVPPVQVMVEVQMLQVSGNYGGNLGLDVKYTSTADRNDNAQTLNLAGRPTDSGAQGLYAHVLSIFSTASLEAFLSALETNAKTDLIAAPRLTTLNNKQASILIGSKLGYKTTIVSQTSTTQVINFLSVGTTLTLTPNVTKNGFIRMKIAPKVSEGQVVNDLPQENTTETANEVMVKDGQTFVIGGLIKEKDVQTDYGVPLLMDIPFIGTLFRKSVITKEKNELLVFVTPHIITPEYLETLNQPIGDMQKKSEASKARFIH
jgi:type IV pilus assembly protein PilQ